MIQKAARRRRVADGLANKLEDVDPDNIKAIILSDFMSDETQTAPDEEDAKAWEEERRKSGAKAMTLGTPWRADWVCIPFAAANGAH